jgi:hypothetical protein
MTVSNIPRAFCKQCSLEAQNPLPLKNSKLWKISISNLFTPEEFQAQNPLTQKNSKLETLYTWRIPCSKPFTSEEGKGFWKISISNLFTSEKIQKFQAQNPLPLKNSKLKTLYPKEFQPRNPLPLKNSKLWKISISNLLTPEEFQVQNPLPLKNSKLKPLYSWRIPKFQAQNSLPLSKSTLKTLGVELETLLVVFYHI